MEKQKLIDIIQQSDLAPTTKEELIAKVEKEGATPEVIKDIIEILEDDKRSLEQSLAQAETEQVAPEQENEPADTKTAEFKKKEIDRLVGERVRELNQIHFERTQNLEKLMDLAVKKSAATAEEGKQQGIRASLDDA
ncbi:MAG: hypothetical protein HQ530_02255 [Parcubacteria group bacterium]|nr:hypothetical protein [Parcubacteria group bacterium]